MNIYEIIAEYRNELSTMLDRATRNQQIELRKHNIESVEAYDSIIYEYEDRIDTLDTLVKRIENNPKD